MTGFVDRAARRLRSLVVAGLLATLAIPGIASAAHTSSECPPQSGTVSQGGTVSIDVTDCAFDISFAGIGPVDTPPAHGNATLRVTGNRWFVDYSHDGSASSTDYFEFTDAGFNGDIVGVSITITGSTSPITVSPGTLPPMTAGTPFSQTLTASGGTAPYTFALQSGVLPVGLSLTSGGTLSGTPTQRGTYSFSVHATDGIGQSVDKGYTGNVANPTLTLATPAGTAIQGVPFSQALNTTGGVAPYTYAIETGSLPSGITLSSAGVVSGTTSVAPGTYAVTLRVTDSSTGPGTYFELETYTLTVAAAPTVSIAVSPSSVSEDGATNLVYTVTRSANLSSATIVNIVTSGTATSGTDYTGGVSTVTIPAGATTATIIIDPTADTIVEADETVVLAVAAGAGYTVAAPTTATGTILNDDVPTATIAVAPAAVAEDGAPNLVYTVTLDQASTTSTSIAFTIGGTATNGTDYATIASPLVIPAGSTSGTITVNPTADATIEADETVVLTLVAGAGYTVGAPATAAGTILNDDLPNLSINDVSLSEGNAGTTTYTFTVSLSAPAGPGGVTFDIATANGTASAGSDYTGKSLTGQTIPAGSSTYSFSVLVNGDTLNEPNETFFVNVTNVTGAVVVDGQGVGTIVNDDPLPALSIDDVSVVEGNSGTTNAVFTVTLNAASGQTVTVNYATADGTATAPSDYTSTSGTLTFTPGQTSRTITVPVIGDTAPEANETFAVSLGAPVNATIAVAPGTGTIVNDDVPVTITPTTLPNATVAVPYSQALTASGGVAPYAFTVTAGVLPAGMTLAPDGTLSGTPTAGGTFNFTVTATDSSPVPGPFSGSRAYSLVVVPPTITLAPVTVPGGTVGTAYSTTISASGGLAPYTYAITAGALPPGLTLAAGGVLSGTPTALGTYNFTVTATDSATGTGPYTGSRAYSVTIVDQPPVAGNTSATVAFNAPPQPITLALSGGPATSVAIATQAAHGTATASGTSISYQPNAGYAGPDSFTYTATNSGGTSAPATVSITVTPPTITVAAGGPLAATVGTPYSQTFTWTGGTAPYSGFQVTGLPAGLSITATTANSVTVSGTPTQAGSFTLHAQATDSSTGTGPFTVGQDFSLAVAAPTLVLTPAAGTLTATYGAPYSQTFVASGGVGPYSYAVTGSLPPGLTLAGATLSGTPTAPGTYAFTVTATDTGSSGAGAPFTVAHAYTLQIDAPVITIAPATLPGTTAGTAYSQTLTASGGVAPYAFAVTAGALPTGLTLSAGGTLSGTPTASGTFAFTVRATDANGQAGTQAYSVTIAVPTLTLTPTTVPGGTAGTAYSQVFTASGGIAPYTVTLTGTLPAGLAFDAASRTLSGTPTQSGTFAFDVTVTDSTGGTPATVTQHYTLTIAAPTLTLTPATLPGGTAGSAYSQVFTVTGGIAPYTSTLTGTLPAGLAFDPASRTLSGTPTQSGTFAFDISVDDSTTGTPGTISRHYTLTIAVPTLTLAPATIPGATAGTAYSQVFTVSGGIAPYTTTLTGTLPAGLAFDATTRTLSGTPTQSGTFAFDVAVTDATTGTPGTVTQHYTLAVAAPTLTLAPATLPAGTAGVAYTQAFAASGGIAPYHYAIASGALPAGLTLDAATGVLAGTPTVAGTFNFSVRATDSTTGTPASVTTAYTLTVSAPVIAITPATLPAGVQQTAYAQTLTATGGSAPYTFAVTAGTLPTGLTLAPTGALSGTPTADGAFAFTVTATDALGFTATRAYTVTIAPRPDPTRDAEVRGLLEAQAQATRRFATAQIDNFQMRLENLHGGGRNGGTQNALTFVDSDHCSENPRSDDPCRNVRGDRAGIGAADAGGGDAMATGNAASNDAPSAAGFWIGGALRSGSTDARTGSAGLDFETDGVSAGADWRLTDTFALGAGVGYGRDATDVGSHDTRAKGTSYAVAGYASYHPGNAFFLDGLLGYQRLSFDLRRYVTVNGATVAGSRDGTQWFGSLSAGADLTRGGWQITPYARVDVSRATLDAYTEQGDALYALAYGEQSVDGTTGDLGVRFGTRRATSWGAFAPLFRLEYQHDFQGDGEASMRYADLPTGPLYATRVAGFDRTRYMLGAGATWTLRNDFSIRVEYRGVFGTSGDRDNGLLLNFQKSY